MLTTNKNLNLDFYTQDGTCFVSGGAIKISNYVMNYRGGNIPFSAMTDMTTSGTYQNSVLSLYNFYNFADLTANYSSPATTPSGLGSFYIGDSTNIRPLGFFTFYYDGTDITLKNSSKVL
jgi:hypothetical protein